MPLIRYKFVTKWDANTLAGIAVDSSGKAYVTDIVNRRIQEFDSNGQAMRAWGDGFFNTPFGIAVHGSNVFVTDYYGSSVSMFTLANPCPPGSTEVITSVCFIVQGGSRGEGPGQFHYPSGIATDDSGRELYVADPDNRRVAKFVVESPCPPGSTEVVRSLCSVLNIQFDEFVFPFDVTVDTTGNLYVADYGKNRIFKFFPSGEFITKWGFQGAGRGAFESPSGIALDSTNSVYVVDERNYRIQKFTSDGRYLTQWGSFCNINTGTSCDLSTFGALVPGDGQFNFRMSKIATNPSGIYLTDSLNERIQKFTVQSLLP